MDGDLDRRFDQASDLIDEIITGLDPAHVSREARKIFLAETQPILQRLQAGSDGARLRLCARLQILCDLLAQDRPVAVAIDAKARRSAATALRKLRKALAALVGAFGVAVAAPLAAAPVSVALPGSTHSVSYDEDGDVDDLAIYNGTTIGFIGRATDGYEYLVVKHVNVGGTIYVPDGDGDISSKTVIGYYVEGSSLLRTDVTLVNGRYVVNGTTNPITSIVYGTPFQPAVPAVIEDGVEIVPAKPAVPAVPQGQVVIFQQLDTEPTPPITSDAGLVSTGQYDVRAGNNGGNGRRGIALFPAKSGGNGGDGGGFGSAGAREVISVKNGGTLSVEGNNAAVILASVGGMGGNGGDGYAGASGEAGGSGGNGGDVYVRLIGNSISTTGTDAHGVVVQSRAGAGGRGGGSYVGSGAGGGGAPAHGGIVDAEIAVGNITTNGDYSHGVFGQSLGGGGGSGGASYNLFGSSGDASPGGNGGSVTLHTSGDIYTKGISSYGVYGQSIGGVGGDAGSSFAVIVAMGGDTAAGGEGGSVTLRHSEGQIFTENRGSHGIFAQSIGGGGGNAGTVGSLVAIGGDGGPGGSAGATQITVDSGSVTTQGDGAHGLFAQSIGGGGGNASGGGGAVAIGGQGSAAGDGRAVTVINNGEIQTSGFVSRGIFAQSVGGGGGEGSSLGGAVSLGGKGSGGGTAGAVTVENNASGIIFTQKAGSDGILAQSIGGGGGVGGGGTGLLGLGANGGRGGNSDIVTVINRGQIVTTGALSRGIMAQSIGGGGGLGGAGAGLVSTAGGGGSGGSSGHVVIGGSNTDESEGRALNITNEGAISTGGNYSSAIVAQSIGGGGGDGANANGTFLAIGGNGGVGGGGGEVTITNSGILRTTGDDSHGILAQSIGGGGGNGGNTAAGGPFFSMAIGGSGGNGGAAGRVEANFGSSLATAGYIETKGDRARAMILQSIGGGGGNGGSATSIAAGLPANASLSIGGEGGNGGGAGELVEANGYLNARTLGDFSDAIFMQSVGGGGGSGGFAISGATSLGPVGAALAMSIGGKGGNGAAGGDVQWTTGGGLLQTSGAFSSGLVAQSIGGGGGSGGFAITAAVAGGVVSGAAAVGVGGSGAGGGIGGTVDIVYNGSIHTGVVYDGDPVNPNDDDDDFDPTARRGDFATGALIQSVGGGGGNGGMSIAGSAAIGAVGSAAGSASLGGVGGTASAGGTVTGRILGQIITDGDMSHGAVIQSVGGGGGNGGFAVAGSFSASALLVGASAAVGIGGAGGGGGGGGTVTGQVGSLLPPIGAGNGVITRGNHSTGLIVQSVGGGGGSGGFSVAGGISAAFGASPAGVVGIGGAGGAGSHGGMATGSLYGGVTTYGDFSGGMLVQSVGGGGGAGGFNVSGGIAVGGTSIGAVVGLGGAGGGGGNGARAVGTLTGGATTYGQQSTAVVVQSIGGGGGSGGFNVTGGISAGGITGNAGVGLGGSGGDAGHGGEAIGYINGMIWTGGTQSDGVLVQSVGGGGGAGSFNVNGQVSVGGAGATVGVGLGGNGGSGGIAELAELTRRGATITTKADSRAIVVQSIGGGGGSGGFNVTGALMAGAAGGGSVGVGLGGNGGGGGTGGKVTLDLIGTQLDPSGPVMAAMTIGANSNAIIAQSVGGGGGAGGFNVTGTLSAAGGGAGAVAVGLGGSGGAGANSGDVTANITGNVQSFGLASTAIIAQSIGGGGGSGGFNVSSSLSAAGFGSGAVAVGLGGHGAGGGNAGDVIGTVLSDIYTQGTRSDGLLYQSLGGGGGSGAFNVSGGLSASGTGSGAVSVGLGGHGAVGGLAGDVTLNFIGDTETRGTESRGLVAQSIGGGGGSGGFNVTNGLSATGTGSGSVAVGLGGSAGGGGSAGDVTFDLVGITLTHGQDATAILAQSIGGGGGSGGFNVTGTLSAAGAGSGAVAIGIGGTGGFGARSGDVRLDVAGGLDEDDLQVAAITMGDGAGAVLAQSIAGGGGSGGFNVTNGLSAAGTGSGAVGVGIGGSGGVGAHAGDIYANVTGLVQTRGHDAVGIVAQSIGGGGGNGGFDVTGALSAAGAGTGGVSVGLGGFGAGGGNGGDVFGVVRSDIFTRGNRSDALLYQSLGGGGGNGGFSVTSSLAAAGTGAGAVSVGLGGSGGNGGAAGDVDVLIIGDTTTIGQQARGLVAQSIGGGGGNGGFAVSSSLSAAGTGSGAVSVGLGGSGGNGGAGGDVDMAVAGLTQTEGRESLGVLAQSIGGGGGNGGFTVTGALSAAGAGAGTVSVGIGGSGGKGGTSGDVYMAIFGVDIDHDDDEDTDDVQVAVVTRGDHATAITAQSLAGGGGNGGFNVSSGLSAAGTGSGAVVVGIGGFGGDGASAGDVTTDVLGDVSTTGHHSGAILAQSLGGGGGSGGFNVSGGLSAAGTGSGVAAVGLGGFGGGGGDAGNVSGWLFADISTLGEYADGAIYQSLGGGGGSGGFNVSGALSAAGTGSGAVAVGLGGFGGGGGSAGDVDVDLTGHIYTQSKESRGLIGQSIGGGGGAGGFNVTGTLSAAKSGSGSLGVGIGGFGGAGGNAGHVSLISHGNIYTEGYESDGIIGLSLGGGGGAGGFNVTGALNASMQSGGALGVGIGGFGGDGGRAGNVLVHVTGVANNEGPILAIYTKGAGATGLTAQSIGGGGGTGGFNVTGTLSAAKEYNGAVSVGIGGFGGGGGNAGHAIGSITGDVVTLGDDAGGILTQSLGGGGGSGGFNVSGAISASRTSSGAISVGIGGFGGDGGRADFAGGEVIGNIATYGDRAGGATYQSLGGGGGNGGFNVSSTMSLTVAQSGPSEPETPDIPDAPVDPIDPNAPIATGGIGGSAGTASGLGGGGGGDFATSIGVGIGGFGGRGGDAGNVGTSITGSIYTEGQASYGVLLQSAGGGGGNGGFNLTSGLAIGNSTSVSVGLGIGGFGGGGGRAGDVTGRLIGNVVTRGDEAFGATLQSVGGGGGNGGFNVTGNVAVTTADNQAVGLSMGLGGFGGGGGHAGYVIGEVDGIYITQGDDAMGVIAQSLGGGGGNGGMNLSGSVAGGMGTSTSVTLGLGGFGGGGGHGSYVDLTRHGATYTQGSNSDGVLAQSVGGGGGNGGVNVSGSIAVTRGEGSDANAIALGLGGFGGGGGNAGNVTARVSGDVFATGYDILDVIAADVAGDPAQYFWRGGSNGIVAQSVGGGGGSGGLNVSRGLAIDKAPPSNDPPAGGGSDSGGRSRAITLGIGGFGGGGGHAGVVDLTVNSGVERLVQVSAIGDDRAGVIAQSLGGGGGVGGINISRGVSSDFGVALGIGGFAGDGGMGGKVFADVAADITAKGTRARGLLAQSVGGGGGAGGINISGTIQSQEAEKPVSISFGLGGLGGAGNISDDVTVNQSGTIFVEGFESTGLLAQSIAGGGGAGGLNIAKAETTGVDSYAIAAGVGGFGGEGANAGAVFVTSVGNILINTKVEISEEEMVLSAGDYVGGAKGLHAQSIGGGGGQAGINVAGATVPNGNPITLGVGGNGGSGGDAGNVHVVRGYTMVDGVEVVQPLLINSFGDNSAGLVAQSIGGGGGSGNYNVALAHTSNNAPTDDPSNPPPADDGSGGSTDKRPAVNLQVGGSGAGAGSGADVTVRHNGTILTDGYASDAVVAQSIGGGGGDAGANIYQAELAQLETMAISVSLGGGAGAAGKGATVIVDQQGRIETQGDYAMGVRAQSIGGGGGSAKADSSSGVDGTATNLNISIGRQGGDGGAAGMVNVLIGGVISTLGDGANAVLAQSIGGGGGDSTTVSMGGSFRKEKNAQTQTKPKTAYSVPPSDVEVSVAFGIDGGDGAVGGKVHVGTRIGTVIATQGDDARGILAQSIGGGGGSGGGASSAVTNAAMGVSIAMGGAGGIGAVSDDVTVVNLGDIVTLGEGSDAILAQSIGGGGGIGGSASSAIDYSIPTVTPGQTKPDAKTNPDAASQNAARAQNGKSVSLALGGTGGVGAAAGNVFATNEGRIVTEGKMAMGIRAQSIGGGGGIAGESSSSLTQGERSSHTLQLAIGGSGGEGAAAGTVEVINSGFIYTSGDRSAAIAASSIGGGGGDASSVSVEEGGDTGGEDGGGNGGGGSTPQPKLVTTNSLSLGIGGSGGKGGTGNDVTVRNLAVSGEEDSGIIITEGVEAYGILAQSIGGGGGNSSVVKVQSDLETTKNSVSLNFALGGAAGDGESAGRVIVENSGRIETYGHGAHAIVAQSIGGGGGNGSMALAVNGAMSAGGDGGSGSGGSGSGSDSLFMAIGGRGGDGGNGGDVRVDNSGQILTLGKGAHGIVAQSIGGGGGNAEMGITKTDNLGNVAIANIMSAALGGFSGGVGGLGGHVTVNHSGDITVLGEGSVAIKAESINGGGGQVLINMEDAIGVAKDLLLDYVKDAVPGAEVVLGQIDSGGASNPDDAGDGADASPADAGDVDPLVVARAGANGVKDSIAGNVTVNSSGTFGVGGAYGVGSLSQAIGGGGGSILLKASLGVAQPVPTSGDEDDGDNGGAGAMAIMADMAALADPVETVVDDLGGAAALGFRLDLGGIDGVNNGGGVLDDVHSGSLLSDAISAPAILAQSIGGGGGRATMALEIPAGALVGPITLSYGAIISDMVAGDRVSRTQNGFVGSVQAQSHAVILQSIGGGGGAGEIVLTGAGAQNVAATILMGADATSNSNGGAVAGQFSGGVETSGARSIGLLLQSIGGGGGESRLSNTGPVAVSLGGTNGTVGDGGDVSLNSEDAIFTSGEQAHGVVLQSIGGGGGLVVSENSDISVTLSNDNQGDGGDILFTQTGAIIASGVSSYAVIAQSLGGGGGWVGGAFAGSAGGAGSSGLIDLNLDGDVAATNGNSSAIFAQSLGTDGQASITIDLTGHVRGGSAGGVGIAMDGGLNNRITTLASLSAVSGVAVTGTGGHDWIDNQGLMVGNVLLGAGDNRVRNAQEASYIARSVIDLGGTGGAQAINGANSFVNEGLFVMGLDAPRWPIDLYNGEVFGHLDDDGAPRDNLLYGSRVIETVALNGNFVQTGTGHMQFDVAYGVHPSDRVNVTGDATVDGTATITLTSLADSVPVTLFATQGTGVDNGLDVEDTIALDYRILADGDGIHLAYTPDFGKPFLRPNEQALGKHMDSALTVGDSEGIGRLMAALGNLVAEQQDLYEALFDQLNPEGHVAALHNQLQIANSFSSSVFGCSERATEVCHWSHARFLETRRKDRGDYLKFDTKGYSLRFGTERAISEDWSLSAAASFEATTDLTVNYGRMVTEGEGFNLGLGARGDVGKLQMAIAATGGWTWYRTRRYTQVFSETHADSKPETGYARASFELAHRAEVGHWHFRPAAEISATLLRHAGLIEKGAGTIGFEALKRDQSFVSFKPSISFGYSKPSETGRFGFNLSAGAAIHTKDELGLPVRFLGANPAADPAALASPMNQKAITGSSRIFYEKDHFSIGLHVDLERGGHTQIGRYGANVQLRF